MRYFLVFTRSGEIETVEAVISNTYINLRDFINKFNDKYSFQNTTITNIIELSETDYLETTAEI